ncbi:MAG: hypothetical protein H7X88_09900 [Gloeobacteraceae cyanobacterium ES-bin-316]|nr:hypothetical protein [Ferruginibacter sp.]
MKKIFKLILCFCLLMNSAGAQTDIDGIMMQNNYFCVGSTVGYSSWKNYWEGTNKRDNANLGTISAKTAMLMGNFGVTNRLNLLFGLPYIKTEASAGTLKGQKGFQDLSLFAKWVAIEKPIGKGSLKGILIGGYATPVSDYTADLLPLSIGMQSKTAMVRLMADYEVGNWFATASGTYNFRSNVTIDKNTYYTTEMHYTNEVKMPDAAYFNVRAGYRSSTWIIEAIADNWTTLGGFDITKNNMPFLSNKMNATKLGIHVKYDTDFISGLSFVADVNTTVSGRNVGQTTSYSGGVFYIMDFSKKQTKETK